MWQRIGVVAVMVAALALFVRAAVNDDWGLAVGPGLTALGMTLLLAHHMQHAE